MHVKCLTWRTPHPPSPYLSTCLGPPKSAPSSPSPWSMNSGSPPHWALRRNRGLGRFICETFCFRLKSLFFFCFRRSFCPGKSRKSVNRPDPSWHEFDYSPRCTQISFPRLEDRSCDSFELAHFEIVSSEEWKSNRNGGFVWSTLFFWQENWKVGQSETVANCEPQEAGNWSGYLSYTRVIRLILRRVCRISSPSREINSSEKEKKNSDFNLKKEASHKKRPRARFLRSC